jgi:hypothetical protein
MPGRQERNCQIRMSTSLWNQVIDVAQELGHKDARGRHSAVIREIVAGATALWRHSPYTCRSADHTVYITKNGEIFSRQVEILRLNAPRERLPCYLEMKPEKRDYYHRRYRESNPTEDRVDSGEFAWFLSRWLLNHFAAWNGKKEEDDLESFQQQPLSSHTDSFGTTYKSADLVVRAVGGRFLTREIIFGLRDYVQWKEADSPIFDRIDIPIDIPTSLLQACVIIDQDLFAAMGVEVDEISNLALEFRNREAARFEGKEVALVPETGIEELYGRSPDDEGAEEMWRKVRQLRRRILDITDNNSAPKQTAKQEYIHESLTLPRHFLFYRLRWPSPHLGIGACVRWEKPLRK